MEPISSTYPRISRDNNFDVIRLFAALQVCTGHIFTHFNISGGIISKILSFFPGVTIFFALSGFLITSSWCHSKTVKQYARNRFLRIFPALFVCFIVLQLAMIITGDIGWNSVLNPQMWMYWLGQLTLGQFFTPDCLRDFGVGAPNGSLWTIPIEIEFYIILPLIFILMLNTNVKKKIMIIAVLSILFNIFLSIISPDVHNTNAAELMTSQHQILIFKLIGVTVAPYLYCFLVGSIIYLYWDKIKILFVNKVIYWLIAYFAWIYFTGHKPSHSITSSFILISNILLCCVSISAAFSFGKVYKCLFGIDISYGIYIIHMIVVNIFIELGYGYTIMHAILALGITIILALLMYRFVEKPALALKNSSFINKK